MMDGKIDIFTVMALVVAVIAFLKLRSVLGRRTDDEEERLRQRNGARQGRRTPPQGPSGDKVVTLPPRRDRLAGPQPGTSPSQTALAEAAGRIKVFASGDAHLESGLMSVYAAEPGFDPEHFLSGARQAYEMIVTAFAEGNRKTLKDLLAKEVYDGFAEAISAREARAEIIDQSFVGISKAEVVEAEVKNGRALVTVRFVSQLISATRDKSGNVTSGDPQKIKDVTDIWTFTRDVGARNPNWRLLATQAAS